MAADPDRMTYDALTTTYRVEAGSSALSQIRRDFYPAAQELLQTQTKECERLFSANPDSIAYEGSMQRKKHITEYLKKIVDLRMNKIASLAVRGAEGANNVIEGLTPEEKEYYNTVCEASKTMWSLTDVRKKKVVVADITEPKKEPVPAKEVPIDDIPLSEIPVDDEPMEEEAPAPAKRPQPEEPPEDVPLSEIPVDDIPLSEIPVDDVPAEEAAEEQPAAVPAPEPVPAPVPEPAPFQSDEPLVVIRILEDLPEFAGPDRSYNLSKEDIVRMPTMMASVLINRGKAMLVPTP